MLTIAALTGTLLASFAVPPPTVTFLTTGTRCYDVSDDGTVAVGVSGSAGFRWTLAGGMVTVPGPSIGSGALITVSGDAAEIASDVADANGKQHAARWQGGTLWDFLPAFVPCDAFLLNTYDNNTDGSVVVGLAWVAGCQAHAFRWDAVNGTVDMGTTVANRSTRANAVNGDGSIIVGWQDLANGTRRGARWDNLVQSLIPAYVSPTGTNYIVGEALGISSSGSEIVGYNVFSLAGGNAWRYSASTAKTTLLPQLAGFTGQAALANGISEDGSVAVGTTGGMLFGRKAIIWVNGQSQDLKTYIESKGGSIAPYTSLGTAMAITPDGRTIVGFGAGAGQPGGWIVTFPAPCPADLDGNGSVGPEDLAVLLGAWGGSGPSDLSGDGTVGPDDLAILLGAWGACGG